MLMRHSNFTNSLLVFITALLASCGTSDSASDVQASISKSIFSDSVSNFTINAIYEIGAEPYTGNIGLSGNDTWDITSESYQSLFSSHASRSVTTPSTLSDMTAIPDRAQSTWSTAELLNLGNSVAPALNSGNTITISVIYLNGLLNNNSNVLGVHITGTHFVFVFKDVVTSVGGDAASQRYVEQATVVHEVGHAVGLVNNGLPATSAHEDAAHRGHTTNTNGVMYFAVASSENILTTLAGVITGGQLNLFESESLSDAHSYHP